MLINNIKSLESAFTPKMLTIFLITQGPIALMSHFVNKYLFDNFEFLKWLIILVFVDLLTGVFKVWIKQGWQCVTSRGFRDTVSKIVQYGSFLIITHVLTHFQVGNGKVPYFSWQWINDAAYQLLILTEIKSIYENITIVNPKLDFMKPILDKLTKYFKNPENESVNTQ